MNTNWKSIIIVLVILMFTMSAASQPTMAASNKLPDDPGSFEASATRVNIKPWLVDYVQIHLGLEVAYTKMGWAACSQGLTMDAYYNSVIKVVVRKAGVVVQRISPAMAKTMWKPSVPITGGSPSPALCMWNVATLWTKSWVLPKYKFDTLGIYKVKFYWELNKPTIDGADTEPDGYLDVYDGILVDKVITVEVVK
ncbi:MAG: hypothetical protein OEY93_10540 [Anaerolineae bacterium]|nr:hypothetical protein [Anaerolineae bacterium]